MLKKTKNKKKTNKKSSITINNLFLHAYSLAIGFMKLADTEEGPHLWPQRLPFYPHNIFPASKNL